MKNLMILVLLVIASCAYGRYNYEDITSPNRITIQIENRGMSPYKVYINSAKLGTVMPGETACFRIPSPHQSSRIYARSMEHTIATSQFTPSTYKGWVWTLGESVNMITTIDLWPSSKSCK